MGLRVCLLLSPRSLPLPFPCSSLFAGLFGFVFFYWGGWLGCCAWVWLCAGAGASVGVGVVGDGDGVAVALWVPCVCAGPQASGSQGAGPGGADGGWLAAVVAWRLRGWSRLLGSAWVAWPGVGVRVGVLMAWADGVVGSVGVVLAHLALHNPHIWANSLKPVCFLCFVLFWCPLLPFIETGTLKIYTKMVLYMKNEIFDLKYPLHGV